jgi:hypothetical protein
MTKITVLLVRHGERLDEVLWRRGEEIPRGMTRDPPLTVMGFRQAYESFLTLFTVLGKEDRKGKAARQIAVFSSPLRRTIGTSLMIWEAFQEACSHNCHNNIGVSCNDLSLHSGVIVFNGLGSCAKYCQRYGGADVPVRAGKIPCGDVFFNNGKSTECPIAMELVSMRTFGTQAVGKQPSETISVPRYLKLDATTGKLVPLSPPPDERDNAAASAAPIIHEQKEVILPEQCRQTQSTESFRTSLDRAVHTAHAMGCDTLIVSTHREAFVSLLEKWGRNGKPYKGHPYCCIAVFEATLMVPSSKETVQWSFHGITPYEKFTASSLPHSMSGA